MTREEFIITLDTTLSRDRITVCLEYIKHLESRTCENCKHHIVNADESIIWCILEDGYLEDCRVHSTFGCNQWEPRDE